MSLTPEERRRIYEEEKARIDQEAEQARRERAPQGTTIEMAPATAGLLCYVGWWISGLIFFIIEQRNEWVRFHAAQSIVTFGILTLAGSLIGLIPVAGAPLAGIVWAGAFVLWIVLMLKAYRGERFKLPVFGDLAEQMVASSRPSAAPDAPQAPVPTIVAEPSFPTAAEPATPSAAAAAPVAPAAPRPASPDRGYFARRQGLHTTGSAFGIAWAVILLIFFNFFNEYIAYYWQTTIGGRYVWVHTPLVTSEISRWLPILNTTLVLAIAGHIVIIAWYNPVLRNIIRFVLDCFGLATVLVLLTVFPFDFSPLPGNVPEITAISVRAGIAIAAIGMGVALVVKFVRLTAAFARNEPR